MQPGISVGASYVPIRDDAGLRSLSLNERGFLRSCALSSASSGTDVLRDDGRGRDEFRKIRIQLGRWDNGAECTVQWGMGTRVTCLCSSALVPPSPDRPSDGIVNFTVDLSPMACTGFLQAPPVGTAPSGGGNRGPNYSDTNQRLLSNRILRCLERIILVGGALDTEALVILPGQWVWRLNVSLTVLDHGGNLLDACVFAAVAALRHYRKSHVDLSSAQDNHDGQSPLIPPASTSSAPVLPSLIPSIVKEATPLPLHHTPLSISFALIPSEEDYSASSAFSSSSSNTLTALVDPNDREELVQLGSLTVAMNIHSEVCLLDYGGGCELTPMELKSCCRVAETSVKQLCQLLEESLKEADSQANRDRLVRLQQQENPSYVALPPLPIDESGNSYFRQTSGDQNMEIDDSVLDQGSEILTLAQTSAEEAYRRQALDYSKGHVASAVRENDDREGLRSSSNQQAGSLLAAMLKSVRDKVGPDGGVSVDENLSLNTKERPSDDQHETVEVSNDATSSSSEGKPENLSIVGEARSTQSYPKPKQEPPEPQSAARASLGTEQFDSDEEETTEVLQSEFQSLTYDEASKKPEEVPTTKSMETVNEDEITDLSMAIKRKKKPKSKKKK